MDEAVTTSEAETIMEFATMIEAIAVGPVSVEVIVPTAKMKEALITTTDKTLVKISDLTEWRSYTRQWSNRRKEKIRRRSVKNGVLLFLRL